MEKCIFDRDEVFSVLIVRDTTLADELKQLNRNKYSSSDDKDAITTSLLGDYNKDNKFNGWYLYSNERASLSMQMSVYKDKHNILEHFVFLSHEDLKPSSKLTRFLTALVIYSYDFDLIIVN